MERLSLEVAGCSGAARATRVQLNRGSFDTPIFMPVGTAATVKALWVDDLEAIGADVILANAYHLYLRPGETVIKEVGGLHRFMNWRRLLLTDSGGFQVFSLRQLMSIRDEGAKFRSHIDGSLHVLSPERSMAVQAALGSDIAMAFDHCPPAEADQAQMTEAMERTTRWAERCLRCERPDHQARFGIVQGGLDLGLRRRHLKQITSLPFDGYALGGLSVGETREQMYEVLEGVVGEMPDNRPRYLMGVGSPEDLVRAIGYGVDMFDCVMPTRNARNGSLFCRTGRVVISNAVHRTSDRPIDEACRCRVCRQYSRAYLSHLYRSKEILYSQLATFHNVHFVVELVREARRAILDGQYKAFAEAFFASSESAGHRM